MVFYSNFVDFLCFALCVVCVVCCIFCIIKDDNDQLPAGEASHTCDGHSKSS